MKATPKRVTAVQVAVLIAVGLVGTTIAPEGVSGRQVGDPENSISRPHVRLPRAGTHGHCYPAQLINEHPLYPQLLRLETQIRRFSKVSSTRWDLDWYSAPPVNTPLLLVAPQPPEFDAYAYATHIKNWHQQRIASLPQPSTQLAADLQSRLRWMEKRLRTDLEEKLKRAAYSEELRLARKRAELVRRHQEALINADVMLPQVAETDEGRPSQREVIMAKIAAEMAREKEESQLILDEYATRMRQEAQVAFVTAQQQLWETMKKRRQTSVSSGSKTATRMSKRLSLMEAVGYDVGILEWKPDAAGLFSESRGDPEADFEAALAAAGRQVAEALGAQRGKLRNQIYREAVLAVSKTAIELDVSISIPPLDEAGGQDMTESLRPLLRRMWQQ